MIVAGDFNVIPTPGDVYAPAAWVNDALFRPETRAHFQALVNLGLTDAYRACHDEPHRYTFWDYQAGAWQKNQGFASTTCCCRRRPQTAWSNARSTWAPAAGRSRQTTCRCGLSSAFKA